jgi:hypothetical protein
MKVDCEDGVAVVVPFFVLPNHERIAICRCITFALYGVGVFDFQTPFPKETTCFSSCKLVVPLLIQPIYCFHVDEVLFPSREGIGNDVSPRKSR